MRRIYINAELGNSKTLPLPEETFHYLFRVLRCSPQDDVIAFNGDGYDYHATVRQIDKKHGDIVIKHCVKNTNESPLYTVLLQGLSKGDRMDIAIQKAVELGVNEIYPVRTEFTTVKLDGTRETKKHQHWQSIITSACEQSERAIVPKLHVIQPLANAVNDLDCPQKIVCHPYDGLPKHSIPASVDRVALLIGPEGGLSHSDLAVVDQAGFTQLDLGQRILRTETATMSALSLAQFWWGDLGA